MEGLYVARITRRTRERQEFIVFTDLQAFFGRAFDSISRTRYFLNTRQETVREVFLRAREEEGGSSNSKIVEIPEFQIRWVLEVGAPFANKGPTANPDFIEAIKKVIDPISVYRTVKT